MSDIIKIFEKIESQFNPAAAENLDVIFQFNVEDDKHYMEINHGNCSLKEGEHDDPSVTLIMDTATFQDIVSGELSGMQAFMAGRLKTEGDMMLATKLSELFSL
jgi:putative sterol carrier protein